MSFFLQRGFNDMFSGITNFEGCDTSHPVNILRGNQDIKIEVCLPGFSRSEIQVDVQDNHINVKASRDEHKTENYKYLQSEFGTSLTVTKSWSLPATINLSQVDAQYDAGILTITLPYKDNKSDLIKKIEIR